MSEPARSEVAIETKRDHDVGVDEPRRYFGGKTSLARPEANPYSQTLTGGGVKPWALNVVQIWLRWSLPWCSA